MMEIVVRDRGGSTSVVVFPWASKNEGNVIVTPDVNQAARAKEMLTRRLCADGVMSPSAARRQAERQVFDVALVIRGALKGRGAVNLGIDELEAVLATLFREVVAVVAVTGRVDAADPAKIRAETAEGLLDIIRSVSTAEVP